MRLGQVILPVVVWDKVEGFGDGRSGTTSEPKPEGFGPTPPGPPVEPRFCETGQVRPAGLVCLSICEQQIDGQGFRATGAHFVGSLGRTAGTAIASLRADRLVARETELTGPNLILL